MPPQPIPTTTTEQHGRESSSIKGPIRIGTLNVHCWHHSSSDNFSRLVELIRKADLHILALQEATKHYLPKLAEALGDWHWLSRHNTALLSRFPLRAHGSKTAMGVGRRSMGKNLNAKVPASCPVRSCVGRVRLPTTRPDGAELDVDVVCIHLDHMREPTRLSQLRHLADSLLPSSAPAVWLGDFNALTRSDYSAAEWKQVADVRARSSWESPVSDLTYAMTSSSAAASNKLTAGAAKPNNASLPRLAMTDAWQAALERQGPLGTSRFGTRIDYVYLSPELAAAAAVTRCECWGSTIGRDVSDHNLVVATLDLSNLTSSTTVVG